MKFCIEFLRLRVTGSEGAVSGRRQPLGYQQLTLTGAAQKLTVPANVSGFTVGYTVIQCAGAAGTDYGAWRDDGQAPTAAIGMRLFSGQELDYTGDPSMIQWIIGSGSPVLNISYYA